MVWFERRSFIVWFERRCFVVWFERRCIKSKGVYDEAKMF